MSIIILKPHVANQIAAGEVVEKPSSVVKELVENSIDAGASMISVDIQNGGIDCIRVSDNGCGIDEGDCENAFKPHATSKISEIEDISHISTLGFRGEALPSIASVADVIMKTRTNGAESGTLLHIKYGELVDKRPVSCTEGTIMEVSSLFAKTPARLKFLKSPRAEAGYISDYVARMMLCYPEISFSFTNNGKKVYQTFGDNDLKSSILCIYGSDTLSNLIGVFYDDGYIRIEGYIGNENLSRSNRSQQSFFLNRRWIQSNVISNALQAAFETRMMTGRFPFAVINIRVALSEVDVNVHPSKLQVRFTDERRVFSAVYNACRKALEDRRISVNSVSGTMSSAPVASMGETSSESRPVFSGISFQNHPHSFSFEMKNKTQYSFRNVPGHDIDLFQISHARSDDDSSASSQIDEIELDSCRIIGEVFTGYWLIEKDDRLIMIDQHAAHERRLYESVMKRDIMIGSQRLLVPETVPIDDLDYVLLQENEQIIKEQGFDFFVSEKMNRKSVVLSAIPVINGIPVSTVSLFDALSMLKENRSITSHDFIMESLIYSSCRHAVKVNEPIDIREIRYLVEEYGKNEIPMTCPHGRPVMVVFTKKQIEKMFKRIV